MQQKREFCCKHVAHVWTLLLENDFAQNVWYNRDCFHFCQAQLGSHQPRSQMWKLFSFSTYWKPLWKTKITKNGWICCWYCLYFYIMNIHAIRICDIVRQGNVPACILSHLLSEYLKHDPHVLVLMQKNTVDLLGANTFLFSFLFSERILRSLPPKTPRLGAELNLLSRHIAEQPSGLPRCLSARCKV